MASRNVAKLVDVPRGPKREMTPLTPEQPRKLLEGHLRRPAPGLVDHRPWHWTPPGRTAGPALGWTSISGRRRRARPPQLRQRAWGPDVQEPKTERSRRTVVLPQSVVTALRADRKRQLRERMAAGPAWVDSGHVFATTIGRPHHAATITRAFDKALARAELPDVRFHDLRHSAATFLLAQGMTLEDVKQLLGHSSIVLTSNTRARA